jgi:Ca-activated chloride channel homolog
VPALIGTYRVLLRRKNSEALRYAGFTLVREASGRLSSLRPHVPALLLLAGLTTLLLAIARPVVLLKSPTQQGTVILLMDVSLSMAASDVQPTRLAAATAAATSFVKAQPRDVRIGVVAFGGHADVVQSPTLHRGDVLAALERLELQRFTAIGNGLIAAILTLIPAANIGDEYDIFGPGRTPAGLQGVPLEKAKTAAFTVGRPAAPGSYLSAAIILVSDGRGTMGVPPAKAAKMAADLGIRVYTVGVGTLYGGVANVEGWPALHAEFDEELLKQIADTTHGEYFLARTASRLNTIYDKLGRRVIVERKEHEVTALLTAIGIALTVASGALSLLWSYRPA